ncbi:MAG: FecR domain-containing protein [Bacteroidales bacterium]|nr:FecR domain-containing protein [Bacteroidales bacterium]
MDDQFTKLASKVLSGEASYDEKQLLKQLLSDNKEHALLFNQLKEYWNADVHLNKTDKESFEASVMSKLNFEPKIRKFKYKELYLRVASVAAVAFFIMTCGMAYLYTSQPKEIYTYSAQSVPVEYLLEDGTKVILNKNSSLTYLSDFGKDRRNVKLTGEAFFKVAKDSTKPFTVEVFGTKTEVLGTSFNVRADVETNEVSTTLLVGSVKFIAENCEVKLKPGEEILYSKDSKQYALAKTDVQFNTAWISGRFNYTNMTFSNLIKKLEKIYRLKIKLTDRCVADRIVSASFLTDEPVENILDALKSELKYNYKIESNQIIISSITSK